MCHKLDLPHVNVLNLCKSLPRLQHVLLGAAFMSKQSLIIVQHYKVGTCGGVLGLFQDLLR